MKYLVNRCRTLLSLFNFYLAPRRVIFLPMILVLLVVAALLICTQGFAVVAPFVYTLF